MKGSRLAELLVLPLTEPFVFAYCGLALVGMPLTVAGWLADVGWLRVVGPVLCAPFAVFTAVLCFMIIPFLVWHNWRSGRPGNSERTGR
jgi:hypothetical protein